MDSDTLNVWLVTCNGAPEVGGVARPLPGGLSTGLYMSPISMGGARKAAAIRPPCAGHGGGACILAFNGAS